MGASLEKRLFCLKDAFSSEEAAFCKSHLFTKAAFSSEEAPFYKSPLFFI